MRLLSGEFQELFLDFGSELLAVDLSGDDLAKLGRYDSGLAHPDAEYMGVMNTLVVFGLKMGLWRRVKWYKIRITSRGPYADCQSFTVSVEFIVTSVLYEVLDWLRPHVGNVDLDAETLQERLEPREVRPRGVLERPNVSRVQELHHGIYERSRGIATVSSGRTDVCTINVSVLTPQHAKRRC